MKSWFIYSAVFVGGASVLAIEILGTRILGPFYGVGLYLWSALIGVTLAALSAGYAIGGSMADRGPTLRRFSALFGFAGLWVLAIPWLRYPVLTASEPLGLRAAVLVSATVLFFPPLMLLGMVSPYAIRLRASSLDVVGRTAGNLYALSTVASVVAAIGTGFFLIPHMGVSRLMFLIGIALVLVSLVGLATARRLTTIAALVIVPLVAVGALRVAPVETANATGGLIAVEHSPYAELRVVDKEGLRFMLIDGGTHTIVDPDTWDSRFPYVDVLDVPKRFYGTPGRVLVVGLGGGSVVKRYARDGWDVDVVEIDPTVTRLAHKYFGLLRSEAQVTHMDGRQYLIEHEDAYDLIIMDAFGSSAIPFHLVTTEAFALIQSRLTPGGILAINIEAVGWHDVLVHSLANTLYEQFANVRVLPIAEPPDQLGNLILLAADRSLELDQEPPVPSGRFSSEYTQAHAWDNRFDGVVPGAPILTDDLNPVDVWAERINLVARKDLHEFFGSGRLGW